MSAEIIPLPLTRHRPRTHLTGAAAGRMVRCYEAAIALGLRAELYAALGHHERSHRCRRAAGRLRKLAFACCLSLLPREERAAFTERILGRRD